MSLRKLILVGSILAMLVLAGCLGPSEGTLDGDMSDDEFDSFIEDRNEAEKTLATHSMTMDMDMQADMGSIEMSIDGDMNNTAEEARVHYDMGGSAAQMPPGQPSEFTAYFDDQYMFMESGDDEWDRIGLDEIEEDNMEEIWDVNETTANEEHYYYGDVYVEDDGEVTTVTTELDGDEMEAAMEDSGADMTGLDGIGSASFDDVTIVEEIDSESHYPMAVEMDGTVSEGGESVSFSVTADFDNHNESDLDYAIPSEVRENATEPDSPMHPMT